MLFQLLAALLHDGGVGIGRHVDFLDADDGAPPERQVDGGAVPIVELDVAAGRHRKGHDRPSGFSRQHDDAEPRDARALRHVGGQRHIIVVGERAHHLLEGADPALAVKRGAVVAGAADGADAQPLGRDRVELAIAMQRDQHLGEMGVLGLDERREEMLAVPEREDRRHLRLDGLVERILAARLVSEAVGAKHQPQPFGREKAHSPLKPAAAQRIAKQLFQRGGFGSWLGSSRRCRCTMK